MPRDPLAWLPLYQHWCRCLGKGEEAVAAMGDLAAIPGLDLAALLPGGPGWSDVQRCLRHDPEGAFHTLYYGLALRGVEGLPAPERLVPAASPEVPQISVLIPVHNHWPLTLNCLRSLVAMANGISFEVIVADDASCDATTQLGRQLPWLRIWRSKRNQGFLDTCNGAAALARGEVLLLLNNDTLVGDHCLDELLDSMERNPQAGVVGAAVWGPNGKPLEVGGIVWANGEVWNHGRGFPPEHWFALRYERQTDYVSGCALAIRRPLWQQLGGFDERYRPAYCEDTDLCLRVWEAGHRVVVQPRARILHLEGLSHARSTTSGLKARQVANLERLRVRWRSRFDLYQAPRTMPWLLAADRGLRRAPIALLAQPAAGDVALCRAKGYVPLVLDGEAQAPGAAVAAHNRPPDVCCLPGQWEGLTNWLLEQLGEPWCPTAVIVAEQPSVAEAMLRHLQQERPQWLRLPRVQNLPQREEGSDPPLATLPGWERAGVRLLASSVGLHPDGWLERANRLVVYFDGAARGVRAIRLDLYLPEEARLMAPPELELLWRDTGSRQRQRLQPGLNVVILPLAERSEPPLILELNGPPLVKPTDPRDQRELLAVLVGLEMLTSCERGRT